MNLFFPMGWTFDLVVLGYQHPAAIGGQTGSGTAPEIDPETCADGRGNLEPLGGEIGFLHMHPLNQDAGSEVVLELRLDEGGQIVITIACYSAAISSEPGNTTGCRRGGIAGRWTKPVAATQFVASRRKPICCGGGDLGNCISA